MKFTKASGRKLDDPTAEANRQNVDQRIAELQAQVQALQLSTPKIIKDVTIPNNSAPIVHHGLGRAPQFVWISPLRVANFGALTAGVIVDAGSNALTTGAPINRSQDLQIGAFGFSTTIVVDVAVF